MIKIKLKSDSSTEKQFLDKLPFSRMEPTCNPLVSTTSAEQTVWKLQTLKLAGFKPLYLFVSFSKELCETEILSSHVEGKETCSFLEVLNECKSKWEAPPMPRESLESRGTFCQISHFPPGRTIKDKFLYLYSLPYPLYSRIKPL